MEWSEHPITDRAFVRGPDGKWWQWLDSRYPFAFVVPTDRQAEAQEAFDLRPDRRLDAPWQTEEFDR